VCGLNHLTAFVVDELSVLPYSDQNAEFTWENDKRKNQTIYIAPGVKNIKVKEKTGYRETVQEAENVLDSADFQGRLPRFDLAVASSLEEIDSIIRPNPDNESALVRPRGGNPF